MDFSLYNNSFFNSTLDETDSLRAPSSVSKAIIFTIFALLFCLSNLATAIIRLYRISIPAFKLNIIFILNFYTVEMSNIYVSMITVCAMWTLIISKLSLIMAHILVAVMTYVGLVAVGLTMILAVLRILMVLQFDRMIELEPEHTARCILASTLLLYSPAAILLPYQQVTSDFIASGTGYFTGLEPSSGQSNIQICNAVNISMAVVVIVFAFTFNTLYLKYKHAVIINSEVGQAQKNLIDIKTALTAVTILLLLVSSAIVVQNFVDSEETPLIQLLLPCCTVTMINMYFCKNQNVAAHFTHWLKGKRDTLEFSLLNSILNIMLTRWRRSNHVSPNTVNIEMNDIRPSTGNDQPDGRETSAEADHVPSD